MRKALAYWFVLAAAGALMGGGRVSLRLLGDTAIMLAPLAIIQLAVLAAVYWTGSRRLRFGPAADAFFAGSWPWIAAFAALAAFSASVNPPVALRWFSLVAAVLVAAAVAWSIPVDYRYYRHALGRTPARAAVDLLIQRVLSWGATSFYLLRSTAKAGSVMTESAAFLTPWQ